MNDASTVSSLIKVVNLNKTFNKNQILKNLSFEIYAGEIISLFGLSGCGKSTLIQLLERFYDPDSGTVTLDGVDYKDLDITSIR